MNQEGFDLEVSRLDELQMLLDKAKKQTNCLKQTLKEINDFEFENKKSELIKNSDHIKKI